MSLPNVVIDWWLGDRWTHKEHFSREVPLNAQRLALTFHRTTYIKWSIVLPLSDEVPCLRNRSAALQGQSRSVERWADLSPWTLVYQWFIFQWDQSLCHKTRWKSGFLQGISIIRHNFAYILFRQTLWRLRYWEKLEFGHWPVFI